MRGRGTTLCPACTDAGGTESSEEGTDRRGTSAAILAGFDYAVDGVNYHFSYALDDQQNFSDTANVCLMKQSGMLGLPDSVTWNAYTPDDELVRLTFDASGFFAL